ncbi:actinodin1 [Centropristis striata]|uniref:actinodin1 n=1 Tax=Centropristis striata TaxID=184440 RepID=UPI0027E0199F|nr:actinodin1 [Centropristis striata]
MAVRRRTSFSGVFIATLLAVVLLPAFLSAGPIVQKTKGDGESIQEKAAAAELHRRLIRNRRNISWYQQNSDFWGWYKYFTDNGNAEAVQEMDRIYLAYLQNKNRAEGRRSYKAYLRHLGDIYKSCADSDDPNCVASSTTRPKPKPEAPKPAPVKTCDPTKDPYCLYAALVQGKSPYLPLVLPAATPAPAPVKAPAPLYVRSAAPAKDPQSGYYYYAPSAVPLLSKEQKAELLRICSADDVECLQYHLRAAHGYAPSAGPVPSYAHLGCDPKKDPACKAKLVQKAPSGLYLQYPNCDPRDPLCAYAASLVAPRAPNPPAAAGPGSCNPLFEEGCNPLTATRFASPPQSYKTEEKEEAAAIRAPPAAEQSSDPYAMFRDAYANANRRQQSPFSAPTYEEPAQEERHPLGPPGKTKEGYDCYIGYDRECYPVKPAQPRSGVHRRVPYPAEAYEPHLNADGTRKGVMEPSNPHCDPEYDRDCRLRRYEPEPEAQPEHHAEEDHSQGAAEVEQQQEQQEQEQYEAEPYQSGQEEPHMGYQQLSQGMPSLQDILRRYGDAFPEQDDHRAYADDYRKK